MVKTIACKRIIDINNEQVTHLQLTYEPFENEDTEFEYSIVREIAGLRHEINC